MHFFSSPTSNILSSTFAPASVAMSRSDSRDSATSTTSYASEHCAWDIRPCSSSSFSSSPHSNNTHTTTTTTSANNHPSEHRRTSSSSSSSSNWTPSPYRSCLSQACEISSTSYLSDDDLLDLPIDVIESPVQKELSTEEQIEMLRAYREREEASHHAHRLHAAKPEIWAHHQHVQQAQQQQHHKKTPRIVRFASEQGTRASSGRRRPSGLRRS